MDLDELHIQDKMIVAEALAYWATDVDRSEEFNRSDPRRNRAAELAEQLLQTNDLRDTNYLKEVDTNWGGTE